MQLNETCEGKLCTIQNLGRALPFHEVGFEPMQVDCPMDIVLTHKMVGIQERHAIAMVSKACRSWISLIKLFSTLVQFYEAKGGERQVGPCWRAPAAVPGQMLSNISCPNCMADKVEEHVPQCEWQEELHCCCCSHNFKVSISRNDVIIFSTWHSHGAAPIAAKIPWPNIED